MSTRLGIVGSRRYQHLERVKALIDQAQVDTWIVSGHGAGVDQCAESHAQYTCRPYLVFPANWRRNGRSAGFKRNSHIIHNADSVVAFWDGSSPGTVHSIALALMQRNLFKVVLDDDPCTVLTSKQAEQLPLVQEQLQKLCKS